MFKNILYTTATLALIGMVSAGPVFGSCPTLKLQDNFDATKYIGVWYEQSRDKAIPFEHFDCNQALYGLIQTGLSVHNTEFNNQTGMIQSAIGTASCNGAQCQVQFNPKAPAGDYRVLSTDYDNYSIVYSCVDIFGFSKVQFIWLLTRTPELSQEVLQNAKQIIKTEVPDYTFDNFHVTKQGEGCQYLF
eukprot:403337426